MAISVVLAVDSIADELVAKIAERIPAIKVGPGNEPDSEMGPLITGEHRDKVARLRRRRRRRRGRRSSSTGDDGDAAPTGFFLNPTLIDNVQPGMACYDDEIFGPVLSVVRVARLRRGRATDQRQPVRQRHADLHPRRRRRPPVPVRRRRSAWSAINVPIPVPVSYYSFGGWKASLFGDTHMYGPEGINFYTRGKVVTSPLARPAATSQRRPRLPAEPVTG